MQSQSQVQQVWDSFVLHLQSLSDGLQLAHEVFSQPEEDAKVCLRVSLSCDLSCLSSFHLYKRLKLISE